MAEKLHLAILTIKGFLKYNKGCSLKSAYLSFRKKESLWNLLSLLDKDKAPMPTFIIAVIL
jgi:hypothetical protein